MSDALTVDVIGLIRAARASEVMTYRARKLFAQQAPMLFEHQPTRAEVRPSSYGSCTLALAAKIRGLNDIPDDPIQSMLAKMDVGTAIGAWEACLLAAACGVERPQRWHAVLEFTPEDGGHIDALLWPILRSGETGVSHVVEFKCTMADTGAIKTPSLSDSAHLLQAADYASRPDVRAPRFTLVYLKPSAKSDRMKQFEFETEPFRALVAKERARLMPATVIDGPLPDADPQYGWSCYVCQYSACSKNKNKAANLPDMLFA